MFNRLMNDKDLKVKVGDRVAVQGYRGTVIDVMRGIHTEWNGTEYAEVEGTEWTEVAPPCRYTLTKQTTTA